MEFHGVKVALLYKGEILMHLRDNKQGLFNANMWDFAGGGREGDETPKECAIRETKEEFSINLQTESFIWEKDYPAQKNPNQKAWFMVALLSQADITSIVLREGQKWDLISEVDFFERKDVIEALKGRFRDFLDLYTPEGNSSFLEGSIK